MQTDSKHNSGNAPRFLVAQAISKLMPQNRKQENTPTNPNLNPIAKWHQTLNPQQAQFAILLYKGILRHYYPLQQILRQLAKQPPKHRLLHALLIGGLYEILVLEKADFAVVNSYVELAKKYGSAPFSNALLRQAVRGRAPLQQKLASLSPLPVWLDKRWRAMLAEDYKPMTQSLQQIPKLGIIVKQDPQGWCDRFTQAGYQCQMVSGNALQLEFAGDIKALPAYDEGQWWVQNISSYLVATLLSPTLKDKKILDICAAPGGKTAYFASQGAEVTALDIAPARMKILHENMQRLQLDCQTIMGDMLTQNLSTCYDAIFLDAPCSALGTIRHNPDLLLHRTIDDITACATTQEKMLRHAWQWLKPAGHLLYAVCSLEPEEGTQIINNFLITQDDAELSIISHSELPDFIPKQAQKNLSGIRLLPHYYTGMDGFFVARLYKTDK